MSLLNIFIIGYACIGFAVAFQSFIGQQEDLSFGYKGFGAVVVDAIFDGLVWPWEFWKAYRR